MGCSARQRDEGPALFKIASASQQTAANYTPVHSGRPLNEGKSLLRFVSGLRGNLCQSGVAENTKFPPSRERRNMKCVACG